MSLSLAHIRIVLVEPAGALNVGSVARVIKNMGLRQLVLVNPQCDPLGDEARQMAVHAADILEAAQRVQTLPEALIGCQRAIATTGLDRTALNVILEDPKTALPWLLDHSQIDPHDLNPEPLDPPPAALIFGREDRGLTKEELNYAQRFVRIPTHPDYSSMNLAQAVAICCYELATQAQMAAAAISPAMAAPAALPVAPTNLATLDALEGYYQQLEAVLLQIGYLYPHTATSRMEKFRLLFNRAQLSPTEVAMLRGILSQVEWALQRSRPPTAEAEPVPPKLL